MPYDKKGKYKNPTVDDYIAMAQTFELSVRSDGDARAITFLANEVIKLRNAMPCPRCLGTPGRMSTGQVYMGGAETYDDCDQCKKHPGKEFKPEKEIFEED
jgi:hypothetical protein